jgi:site-specific DNA recombinase
LENSSSSSNSFPSVNAERERVGSRYVRRLLRLAFLAPKIIEAITAGDQPPELTAEALAERIDLPLLWTAQEKAVGIAS